MTKVRGFGVQPLDLARDEERLVHRVAFARDDYCRGRRLDHRPEAAWLAARPRAQIPALAFSALLMVLFATQFATWHWVA